MDIVKASVSAVVELILRNGDIDSGSEIAADARNAAVLGSKAHKKIQKAKFEGYKSEVALNCEFEFADYGFTINFGGRADGVFTDDTGTVCIDEIKSTLTPLEFIDGENILHWGQAMCYAYMYMRNSESGKRNSEFTNSENNSELRTPNSENINSENNSELRIPNSEFINVQITYYNLETEDMKVYKNL